MIWDSETGRYNNLDRHHRESASAEVHSTINALGRVFLRLWRLVCVSFIEGMAVFRTIPLALFQQRAALVCLRNYTVDEGF